MKLPSNGDTDNTMGAKFSLDHQSDQTLEQLTGAYDNLALDHDDTSPPGSETSACDVKPYPGRLLFKFL